MNRSMADLSPTHTLLAEAKAGSRQAFAALVATFRDRLAAALGPYLATRPDARRELDEVVNEAFARAFEAIGRFEPRGEDSFFPWLFGGPDDPCTQSVGACLDAADANDDGRVDIADAVKILAHLFAQAGPLPAPFGACGEDPTADGLDCGQFPSCE